MRPRVSAQRAGIGVLLIYAMWTLIYYEFDNLPGTGRVVLPGPFTEETGMTWPSLLDRLTRQR